jgi:hypothetical protein
MVFSSTFPFSGLAHLYRVGCEDSKDTTIRRTKSPSLLMMRIISGPDPQVAAALASYPPEVREQILAEIGRRPLLIAYPMNESLGFLSADLPNSSPVIPENIKFYGSDVLSLEGFQSVDQNELRAVEEEVLYHRIYSGVILGYRLDMENVVLFIGTALWSTFHPFSNLVDEPNDQLPQFPVPRVKNVACMFRLGEYQNYRNWARRLAYRCPDLQLVILLIHPSYIAPGTLAEVARSAGVSLIETVERHKATPGWNFDLQPLGVLGGRGLPAKILAALSCEHDIVEARDWDRSEIMLILTKAWEEMWLLRRPHRTVPHIKLVVDTCNGYAA